MGTGGRLVPLDDPERLMALRATGLLDSAPEAVFDRITRLAGRLLQAPTSLISLVDVDRQFFKSRHASAEPWTSATNMPLEHSFCRHVVQQARPVLIDDARQHPLGAGNPSVAELGVVAYAGTPLVLDTLRPIGVLCAIDSRPRRWSDDDVALLSDLAEVVMTEIRLRVVSDELLVQTEALSRSEHQLREERSLLEAVLDSMEEGVMAIGLDGELLLRNEGMRRMFGDIPVLAPGAQVTAGASEAFGIVQADGLAPVTADALPAARALRGEHVRQALLAVRVPGKDGVRYHSVNATPLRDASGQILGAVTVGRDVTETRQLQDRLVEQSLVDELTGLYNRRGFLRFAGQHLDLARRHGRRAVIAFADLDDLKRINDELGHEAGDLALCVAADALRATFRTTDVLGRLGGDELVALAIEADGTDALAARLAAAVETANAAGHPFRISLSMGFATFDPDTPEPIDRLLARADKAMYARKRTRRITTSPVT